MKWKVTPIRLDGTIAIPPSKSHTIRALLLATLAEGVSKIHNPLLKGDGYSAINAARCLGAQITHDGTSLLINGVGNDFNRGEDFFDMGNSGTSTNLFTGAAAVGSRKRTFDGDASLRSRPVKSLLEALEKLGAQSQTLNPPSHLPFSIQGPLKGGRTRINGISSQYLSSLLFCCPLIKEDTEIEVFNLHEKPYVDITLWWLKRQNIELTHDSSYEHFSIRGGQRYTPFEITVPSDFSSATFAAVAAVVTSSVVTLQGLDFSDPQGDKAIFDILKQMGAIVTVNKESVTVDGRNQVCGGEFDLNEIPDSLPALCIAASVAKGRTRFYNVAQARIKETDRIAVMHQELSKMGIVCEEFEDGLTVVGGTLKGSCVCGHDDHRVVMALSLAGMIAQGETVIETAEAAEVTYPSFVKDFNALGAHIEIQ